MFFTITTFVLLGLSVTHASRRSLREALPVGPIEMTASGVLGAILGFSVASVASGADFLEFHPAGILGSFVGAITVLTWASLLAREDLADDTRLEVDPRSNVPTSLPR